MSAKTVEEARNEQVIRSLYSLAEGKGARVFSFHCYVAVPILLEQLGVFMNLRAALRH